MKIRVFGSTRRKGPSKKENNTKIVETPDEIYQRSKGKTDVDTTWNRHDWITVICEKNSEILSGGI